MRAPWMDGVFAAALGLAAILACNGGGGGGTSNSANWPLAQTPGEVFLQTKPPNEPMKTHTKNSQGEYAVLPNEGVKLRVSAPWPGDIEVSLDNVPLPKEESQGAPACVAPACIGYYKIGTIDASTPMPLWELVVLIPSNKQGNPLVTLDVHHVSLRPGVTGTDKKSAPLKFLLVQAPAPPAPPPPPAPSADVYLAFRDKTTGESAACEQDLKWEWTPAGPLGNTGVSGAFKIPSNQPFKLYKTGPVKMKDGPSEHDVSWYCKYQESTPALATGDWTVTLHKPQSQIASCTITLTAGENYIGFTEGKNFCRLKTGGTFMYFEYP